MRHFIGIKTNERVSRKYGGSDVGVTIYEIIDNEPRFCTTLLWCTRSYKGGESEILNQLAREKKIDEKYRDSCYRQDNPDVRIYWFN